MTWNYRVIHQELEVPGSDEKAQHWAIHECYYDETGNITEWTVSPVYPIGNTKEEIMRDCGYYSLALTKPMLEWAELEKNGRILTTEEKVEVEKEALVKLESAITEDYTILIAFLKRKIARLENAGGGLR